ncbi:MAG: hypothetical protein JRG97_11370 [Deltaproteobacteria bacterium]|nr:hypothetical protein [Deltaproteobacteria bacterium]MBW2053697.1 hypothetical protein [Deltaproteobacteria bacterium]MBW2141652.1 hypothetical protein [Deltaproteobacteria bacterium]
MTLRQYIHIEPECEVESISGHYEVEKEIRFPIGGREVLCIVGYAAWDKSCCAAGGCRYIMVPGYLVKDKTETNDDGLFVSEVEIVNDKIVQKKIKEFLKERGEFAQLIDFW